MEGLPRLKTLIEWEYGADQDRMSPALTQQFTTGELQQSELVLRGKILRVMGEDTEGKILQSSALEQRPNATH